MKLLTTGTVVPVVNTGFNFSMGTVDFKIVVAGKFAIISFMEEMKENLGRGKLKESFHVSEILFAISGVLILISAFVIYQTENFTLWNLAKLFYLLALILFIKYA